MKTVLLVNAAILGFLLLLMSKKELANWILDKLVLALWWLRDASKFLDRCLAWPTALAEHWLLKTGPREP